LLDKRQAQAHFQESAAIAIHALAHAWEPKFNGNCHKFTMQFQFELSHPKIFLFHNMKKSSVHCQPDNANVLCIV